MALDQFLFGLATFTIFVIAGPFGGPSNAYEWMKNIFKNYRSTRIKRFTVYFTFLAWCLERLTAGLGFWFFVICGWTDLTYIWAIASLFLLYIVIDWYCWPPLYFHPMNDRNYLFIFALYGLGWLSQVVAWILMIVKRAHTNATFFYTGFGLMAASSLFGIGLAVGLYIIYDREGSMSQRKYSQSRSTM